MKIVYKQFAQILKNSSLAGNLKPEELQYFLNAYQNTPAKVLIQISKEVIKLDQKYLKELRKQNEIAQKAANDLESKIKEANSLLKKIKN